MKKGKKGFTLVELLAVIAIIAILAIISLPNVIKMYNQAKKNLFYTQVKEVYKTSHSTWASDTFINPEAKTYARINGQPCGETLKLNGDTKIDYVIITNSDGKVITYYASDKNWQMKYDGEGLDYNDLTNESVVDVIQIKDFAAYKFQCILNKPKIVLTYGDFVNDTTQYGNVAFSDTGTVVNDKIKKLANPGVTIGIDNVENNITAIVRSTTPPSDDNKEEINTISSSNSPLPAYAWYENGTIYWWTESGTLVLNQDCGGMFKRLASLEDISSFQYFDTSQVRTMGQMFNGCTNLADISVISNWNTSKLENITWLLSHSNSIQNLSAIKDWDVSKVTLMTGAFNYMTGLTSADLSGWDTSNVTNMSGMFDDSVNLASINLSGFDTSKVTDMSYMFKTLPALQELDISNFDTRNVTNFKRMFYGSTSLAHIYVGDNWDTSANTGETANFFPNPCVLPNYSSSNTNARSLQWAKYSDGGYLTYKANN